MRRGQAAVEYIALLAVLAAVLVAAGPARAPDIPRGVVHGLRLGLCIVTGDVCTPREAAAAALPPCPMAAETKGSEIEATFFSIDLGTRGTLAMTSLSDGSVQAAWSAGGRLGVSGGFGLEGAALGPVHGEVGRVRGAGVRRHDGPRAGRSRTSGGAALPLRPAGQPLARAPAAGGPPRRPPSAGARRGRRSGTRRAPRRRGRARQRLARRARAGHRDGRSPSTARVAHRPERRAAAVQAPAAAAGTDLLASTRSPHGPALARLPPRRAEPAAATGSPRRRPTLDLRDPANRAAARPVIGACAAHRRGGRRARGAAAHPEAGTTQLYTSAYNDPRPARRLRRGLEAGRLGRGRPHPQAAAGRPRLDAGLGGARAGRLPASGELTQVAGDVPRPQLDDVAVGVVDVGRARVGGAAPKLCSRTSRPRSRSGRPRRRSRPPPGAWRSGREAAAPASRPTCGRHSPIRVRSPAMTQIASRSGQRSTTGSPSAPA